ncbi:hypothetical protein C3747_97g181 [Trypanosoma cruzi]|uniref:Uncharacterized protein n=2 Tax=Trypanosoma cruzi TaxID=5693 RepID=Q4E2D6_TRYCC|nr:hypothetical protein, conserved [Trypanosoma cruzi]EAN98938.1 hypothetical protein, conserved [Trypanosoma cruzi]PWV07845.1 hypothetical protein C3747_97g181 [Trypanosoma cruzi]RNC57358.1 hypothetical protein TcCL_ESM05042 [Trypanosoma cruzi]|eukprot:XP_820789.1 hypothetical protein [Trypanosoma cruzi strain CL Brener]
MTFSERDAILNDDEEWVNIPTVLRSFLRQINNELQNNRLTCDAFLDDQKEHDRLLKGILSKQLERELEMKKSELTMQQECQEVQASFSEVLGTIREQMRHLNEEQQQIRDRIRQIENRVNDTIAMHDEVRAESSALSKKINQRSMELEREINNKFRELLGSVEELKTNVRLVSERQDAGVRETKKELEGSNVAWRQLGDAVSVEMDNLRIHFQQHEDALGELKSFKTETEREIKKRVKAYTHLHEKICNSLGMVKQLEISSEDRFETVFSALEKSQALTEKLSQLYHKRDEDNNSLMTVLRKAQGTYNALTGDLKKAIDLRLTQHGTDLEQLNRRIRDLYPSKDEVTALVNEKSERVLPYIEEMRQRIEAIESAMINKPNPIMDIENAVNELMKNDRHNYERKYAELHQFISNERSTLQNEIKDIKTTVGILNGRCEQAMHAVRRVDNIEGDVQRLGKQVNDYNESLKCVRNDMDAFTTASNTIQERSGMIFNKNNKNDPHSMICRERDVKKCVTEVEFLELKASVEREEENLGRYAAQLNEIQQRTSRFENLVKEVPRTYQRYMEALDKKLSPALLELDVLQRRIAALELRHAADEPHEVKRHSSPTRHEESELESLRLNIQQNQALQFAQRKIQEVDVRLDGLQVLCNRLERRVETLSREVADVSEKSSSIQEEQHLKKVFEDEMKRVFGQLSELKKEMRSCEKGVKSRERSLLVLKSDMQSIKTSFESVSDLIVTMEKTLGSCITVTSDEWKKVYEAVSTFSGYKLDDVLRRLQKESEAFVSVERFRLVEEALAEISSEQMEFKRYLEQFQESGLEKVHMNILPQSGDDLNQPRFTLEERVILLEESARKNLTQMTSNTNDVILSFDSRVKSLEVAVGEIRAKEPLPPTPSEQLPSSLSLLTMNDVPLQMAAMGERVTKLESWITTMHKTEKDAVVGAEGFLHGDRLASLESSMVTCKREVEENSRLVAVCQRRIDEWAERLTGDDSARKTTTAAVIKSGDFLAGVMERLQRVESKTEQIEQSVIAEQKKDTEMKTKRYVEARFKTLWESILRSIAPKVDRKEVNENLTELQRWAKDYVEVQLNASTRELKSAIEECVSITEVRELVLGARGSAA